LLQIILSPSLKGGFHGAGLNDLQDFTRHGLICRNPTE